MKAITFIQLLFNQNSRKINRMIFLLCLYQFAISIISPCISALLGKTLDMVGAKGFLLVVALYLLANIIVSALSVVREKCRVKANYNLQHKLKERLFYAFFAKKGVNDFKHGTFFTLVVGQVDEFSFDSWQIVLKLIEIAVTCTTTIMLSFFINIGITWALIIAVPPLSFLTIKIMAVASKTHILRQESDRQYSAVISEAITLIKEFRVFRLLNFFSKRYNTAAENKQKFDTKHLLAVLLCRSVEQVARMIGYAMVLCIGIFALRHGTISMGNIIVLLAYVNILLEQAAQVNYIYDMWISNRGLYDAMQQYQPCVGIAKHSQKLGKKINKIAFKNLSFFYTEGKNILDRLNLEIISGEKIAIVGASGGGKSTLLKILVGQLPVMQNCIFINDIDITNLDEQCVREHIAYLSQVPFVFDGTLLENLQWAVPNIRAEQAAATLKAVNLGHLSSDGQIGEGGRNLSGGERQRLAIARCLLKNSEVLILDEPFSQLDAQNECAIVDLLAHSRSKIVVLTTHKHDIFERMDKVFFLKSGKII